MTVRDLDYEISAGRVAIFIAGCFCQPRQYQVLFLFIILNPRVERKKYSLIS